MKVVHVISDLDPRAGGPVAALDGLARALCGEGVDVTVVATYTNKHDLRLAKSLLDTGVNLRLIGPAHRPLAWVPGLCRQLAPEFDGAEVIHVHALWEEVQHHACSVAHRLRIPFVIRPCGMLDKWSLSRSALQKRLYLRFRMRRHLNRAAAIHYLTRQEADSSSHLGLVTPSIVEPNGIDLDAFTRPITRGHFRGQYRIPTDRKIVAFLGRIDKGKGVEYLVPAWARLPQPRPLLVVIGPDWKNFRTHVNLLVQEHSVNGDILFTGMLKSEAKIAALRDADLFAMPSEHENFGVAVIEALAAGLPAVVSDQVALGEVIRQHDLGSVVPIDPAAIAAAIQHWLARDDARHAAGQRAADIAADLFNWRNIARRWIGHYQQLAVTSP